MAAIGKIRSWGPTLVIVIGLALFAFIAEEMFRSCEATSNEKRQQVGEVLGKKISVQDFQSLVDEYQQVIKMTQGRDNLSEEELNQVKDQKVGLKIGLMVQPLTTVMSSQKKKLSHFLKLVPLNTVMKRKTSSLVGIQKKANNNL